MHASINSYDWIADTGATAHIVLDKSLFHDYPTLSNDSVVHSVGNTAKVVGKGSIKLKICHSHTNQCVAYLQCPLLLIVYPQVH